MRAPTGERTSRAEAAIAASLFVGTFAYLHQFWPNSMVGLDEGAFLYEAKRVLDGEVMYRDFFDLLGPTAFYAMAIVYAAFGVSMEVARTSMAVVHGAIVVLTYAIARQMGARRSLAAVLALAHLALFYPGLPIASPHWISTVLTLSVFCLTLRGPICRTRTALGAGVLTALVAMTQQPKGAATAAAVAIVLLRDGWTARRANARWLRALARQLVAYAIGLGAVVGPMLIAFVAAAGFAAVYEALVYMPLIAYPRMPFHRGGQWILLALDAPTLLRLALALPPMLVLSTLPLIVPLSAARLLWQMGRRVDADARRPLFVAVVFSALSIASVLYQPNYFHLGIVGPIWVSLYAELLERGLQRIEHLAAGRVVAPAVVLALLALLAFEMRRSLRLAWDTAGVPAQTAFGLVHFRSEFLADEVVAVRTVLENAGAKDVLVYPTLPGLYLMTGTSNPTRFQLLMPGYTTPEQFAEVQHTLERERVPFVIRTFWWWGEKGSDPLLPYLRAHYERVKPPRTFSGIPSMEVMRRKPDRDPPAR